MSERASLAEWRDELRDSKLDVIAKLAGFVLSTYFTREGLTGHDPDHPAPAKSTIAAGASVSKRTVDAAIERLVEAGFLAVTHSLGRRPHRYEARIPTVQHVARLNGAAGDTVEEINPAAGDAQPCRSRPLTVQQAAPESIEGVESGARQAVDFVDVDRRRAWAENVGIHYAHDRDAFYEEISRAGVSAGAVADEELRLELHAREAA